VDDRGVRLGEQIDLLVIDVDAVSQEVLGREQADIVGVREGSLVPVGDDGIDLAFGLVGVKVHG